MDKRINKINILVLVIFVILTLILTSCSKLEYAYVIRGEKDINNGTIIGLDDIFEILGCKEDYVIKYVDKITGTKYILNDEEITEEEFKTIKEKNDNYQGVPVVFTNYNTEIYLFSFLATRIHIFDTVEEAKKAYIGNLSNAELYKDEINFRINNIIIVNHGTYFKYEDEENLISDPKQYEKNDELLEYFGIKNEVYKITKTSKLERIKNFNEQKLIDYFEDNGYIIDYFKIGDPSTDLVYGHISSAKYGYVIRDNNKKSYVVIKHLINDENEKAQYETLAKDINEMLDLYSKDANNEDSYFNGGYYSYLLYDGQETIIWSESKEWIDLIVNILK